MFGHRHATMAVLAAATVVGLGGGIAVAASTGSLPIAAGDHPHTTSTTRPPTTSAAPAVEDTTPPTSATGASNGAGPDATGPAKFGLCTAYSSGEGVTNGDKADSTAFQALATAAGGAANIPSFCADATPGGGVLLRRRHPGRGRVPGPDPVEWRRERTGHRAQQQHPGEQRGADGSRQQQRGSQPPTLTPRRSCAPLGRPRSSGLEGQELLVALPRVGAQQRPGTSGHNGFRGGDDGGGGLVPGGEVPGAADDVRPDGAELDDVGALV